MRPVPFVKLALAVRQRADIGGQNLAFGSNTAGVATVTDAEMTTMLNQSVSEVWGKLIRRFGDNYAFKTYSLPLANGTQLYDLPYDFKHLLGVDGSIDGVNWTTIPPYTEQERNSLSFVTTAVYYGGSTTLRYQLQGNQLSFIPAQGQFPANVRIRYLPTAPVMGKTAPTVWQALANYNQGDLVQVNVTTANTQAQIGGFMMFEALNTGIAGNSNLVFQPQGGWEPATGPKMVLSVTDGSITWAFVGPVSMFADGFDGICGWEELVVVDCAIKCRIKEESDVADLMAQKTALLQRMDDEAATRQAADPMTVSGGFGTHEGSGYTFGPGWGFGWG